MLHESLAKGPVLVRESEPSEEPTRGPSEVPVATDGGKVLEGEAVEATEPEKPYTTHIEPAEQGGTFARCTGRSREIIPVGRFDKLDHADGCPVDHHAEE